LEPASKGEVYKVLQVLGFQQVQVKVIGQVLGFKALLYIVKDVVVVFREAFNPSIHPSRHPSMDGIIQGRKPWQK
jgi:hypothetical protein